MGGKPWSNTSPHAVNEFYNAKGQWSPSWEGNSDMQIDWVKIWEFEDSEEPDFLGN